MNVHDIIAIAQDLEMQFNRQDYAYAWYTASKLQNRIEELKWYCREKEAQHHKAALESSVIPDPMTD